MFAFINLTVLKHLKMVNSNTSCIKSVGGTKICANCSNKIVKHGTTKAGKQRYKCKNCNKTVVAYYSYNACLPEINSRIILYIKEGLGIRSIARRSEERRVGKECRNHGA